MLQQTQVATVLAYFDRFIARFPDVRSLAAAEQGEVLALWSGLGYYGRARHLHRCAQLVVARHGGEFPRSSAALAALPGIGRSTAAAIAAFCFGERVAILDGNVKRVLARVLAFEGDLAEARAERELWDAATALLPATDVEGYTQGLMDLGATICLARSPRCLLCPVNDLCAAARRGAQERYPIKSRRRARGRRANVWLDLRWRGQVWLVPRPPAGVWAGLWSWPEFATIESYELASQGWPGRGETLPAFTHVLTHVDWLLQPVRWTFPSRTAARTLTRLLAAWPGGRWFDLDAALALGLPAPLRKRLSAR
jgi:A/G-specific adenine glycosylase